MTRETSNNWTCRRILHAGDGPPDKEEKIRSPQFDAGEAAERFAEILHDREAREDGAMSDSDFDGVRSIVEVKTESGWKRFVVACRVVRQYSASEIKTQEPTK